MMVTSTSKSSECQRIQCPSTLPPRNSAMPGRRTFGTPSLVQLQRIWMTRDSLWMCMKYVPIIKSPAEVKSGYSRRVKTLHSGYEIFSCLSSADHVALNPEHLADRSSSSLRRTTLPTCKHGGHGLDRGTVSNSRFSPIASLRKPSSNTLHAAVALPRHLLPKNFRTSSA